MAGDTEVWKSQSLADVWQYFKIPIILGAVSLLCIVLSITLYIKSYQSSAPIEFSSSGDTSQDSSPSAQITITVDIEGAVENPGVYAVPFGSRVEDAITIAGGLSKNANLAQISQTINRAAKLSDGAKLFFPLIGSSDQKESSVLSETSGLVNVNTASQSELETLSGIGPATAKKIIDNRPYQTLEELVSKKALGQATFDKLKNQLGI